MKSHRCDFQTTEIYCRYSCLQLFFQFVHENRDECVATGNNETFVCVLFWCNSRTENDYHPMS